MWRSGGSVVRGVLALALLLTVAASWRPLPAEAEPLLVAVGPDADAYVNSDRPNKNYGRSRSLYVDGGPNQALAYLRFELPPAGGLELRSATLRLVTTDGAHADTNGTVQIVAVDSTWSETGRGRITWVSRPPTDTEVLGQLEGTEQNETNEVPLSPRLVGLELGSTITLALTTTSSNGAFFWSTEADPDVRPVLELVLDEPSTDPVVVAVGDIACPTNEPTPDACQHEATSDVALALAPDGVLALGDLQYFEGSLTEFQGEYDRTWGRLKAVTRPVPGNHEYGTAGAAGYFDYFYEPDDPIRGRGYDSFGLGEWHIVGLNSNCAEVGCEAGSEQEQWLRADLAASTAACILAYWHHPWYTSGTRGPSVDVAPLAQALHDHGVDVLLVGHNHFYERFAPLDPAFEADPSGIRQFIVGTGGKSVPNLGRGTYPHRETRNTSAFGVLQLTLRSGSYDWEFVAIPGSSYTDVGSAPCTAS